MTGDTTEHTEVVVKVPLSFLLSQLTILAELIGDRGGVAASAKPENEYMAIPCYVMTTISTLTTF